jgi:hypothetical protein
MLGIPGNSFRSVVGAAVVDDDNFKWPVVLGKDRCKCTIDGATGIEGRYHHAD